MYLQDKCVWPAYLSAHAPLFVDGNVEQGDLTPGSPVELLQTPELSMDDMVNRTCAQLYEAIEQSRTGAAEEDDRPNGHSAL